MCVRNGLPVDLLNVNVCFIISNLFSGLCRKQNCCYRELGCYFGRPDTVVVCVLASIEFVISTVQTEIHSHRRLLIVFVFGKV